MPSALRQVGIGHLRGLEFLLQGQDEVGGGAHGSRYRLSIPRGCQWRQCSRKFATDARASAALRAVQPKEPRCDSHALADRSRAAGWRAWRLLAAGRVRPRRWPSPRTTTTSPTSACCGACRSRCDVLSNLPFALAGGAGAWRLLACRRGAGRRRSARMAWLFFAGLLLTALRLRAGTTWQPDDAGLAVDRAGHGGGLRRPARPGCGRPRERARRHRAGAGRAGARRPLQRGRLGRARATCCPGPCCRSAAWCCCGAGLARRALPGALADALGPGDRWLYALAKLLELDDHAVCDLTGQLVSGHSLKHVAAAWPPGRSSLRSPAAGQNAAAHRTRQRPAGSSA